MKWFSFFLGACAAVFLIGAWHNWTDHADTHIVERPQSSACTLEVEVAAETDKVIVVTDKCGYAHIYDKAVVVEVPALKPTMYLPAMTTACTKVRWGSDKCG